MLPSLSAPDNVVLKLMKNVCFKVLARQKHPQSNPTSWHNRTCTAVKITSLDNKYDQKNIQIFPGSEKISPNALGTGVSVRYKIKSFSQVPSFLFPSRSQM